MAEREGFDYYMETSAKTGSGIWELFQQAAKHIYVMHRDELEKFVDDEKWEEYVTKNSTIYRDSVLEPVLQSSTKYKLWNPKKKVTKDE